MIYVSKFVILFLLPLIFLSGCFNEKKKETFNTVEYYVKNKEARDLRRKECMNLTYITEAKEKDCANANTAFSKVNRRNRIDYSKY